MKTTTTTIQNHTNKSAVLTMEKLEKIEEMLSTWYRGQSFKQPARALHLMKSVFSFRECGLYILTNLKFSSTKIISKIEEIKSTKTEEEETIKSDHLNTLKKRIVKQMNCLDPFVSGFALMDDCLEELAHQIEELLAQEKYWIINTLEYHLAHVILHIPLEMDYLRVLHGLFLCLYLPYSLAEDLMETVNTMTEVRNQVRSANSETVVGMEQELDFDVISNLADRMCIFYQPSTP